MMSRRARSGPAISLFAFQDIITSVTAIIIVMVLCLSLELVQQHEHDSSTTSQAVAREVTTRIAEIEQELTNFDRNSADAQNLIAELAEAAPATLREEVNRLERSIAALTDAEAQQQAVHKKWHSQQLVARVKHFDQAATRKQLQATLQEVSSLTEQRDQESKANREIFSLPRGIDKQGWIVVVSQNRIETAPLGHVARPTVFESSRQALFGTSAVKSMTAWLDRQSHYSRYFLLMIRPDGIDASDELIDALRTRSISFGFDLVESGRKILDPERGAAP